MTLALGYMKKASGKTHGGRSQASSDPAEPRKIPIKLKDGTTAYYQPKRSPVKAKGPPRKV